MDNTNSLIPHDKVEEAVEEVVNDTTTETETKFNPKDYQLILNMINEVDESYRLMKESIYGKLAENNLKPSIIEALLPYSKEDIQNMDIEKMNKLLYDESIDKRKIEYSTDIDDLIATLIMVKSSGIILTNTKLEAEKAKASSQDVLKEYFNYISSDKVRKSREERLANLKEAVENETNYNRKYQMLKMIKTIEDSMSFNFLQDRFKLFGKKEVELIEEGFFNERKGTYIMERFSKRIGKFGYNEEIYKNFFNIEENFLPKEYSPFNNIFLYFYIRFIAYADPYSSNDKMLVQSLTSSIANLIYHKFESLESEQYFIKVIEGIVDNFKDDEEKFKNENTTYEKHPIRVASEKEHEQHRREALIKSLNRLNVTDFDPDMDIEEMQKLYSERAEELINKQQREEAVSDNIDEESESTDEN